MSWLWPWEVTETQRIARLEEIIQEIRARKEGLRECLAVLTRLEREMDTELAAIRDLCAEGRSLSKHLHEVR